MSNERQNVNRRQLPPPNEIVPQEEEVDITQVNTESKDYEYWKNIAFAVYKWGKGWKQRYLHYHQTHMSETIIQEQVNNEFKGILRSKSTIQKYVLEEVMVAFSAHKNIQEVVNEIKPRSWLKITRNLVLLALGGLLIFGAITSEPFRTFLSANAMYISIIAISGVIIYIYFDRKKD